MGKAKYGTRYPEELRTRRGWFWITSYVRNDWLIWHQVVGMLERSSMVECVSVRLFGQQHVSPMTNTEYAFSALSA